jgi:hypothetical protein
MYGYVSIAELTGAPVPEPTSAPLVAAGLLGFGLTRRQRA